MKYLAIDLGATSGRFILSDGYSLKEVYRFENHIESDGTWNIERIILEIRCGLHKSFLESKNIKLVNIDTWGVDFFDLDCDNKFIKSYRHYENIKKFNEYMKILDVDKLYSQTGIIPNSINTLYRITSSTKEILFLRDYLYYYFTGEKITDNTILSTSGFYDFENQQIANEVVKKLKFNPILPRLVEPGISTISFLPYFHTDARLFIGAAHDTANCFYYYQEEEVIILNIGTWAIIGMNCEHAVKTKEAFNAGYSNEKAINGYRFLKNIDGLYIFDQKRRELFGDLEIDKVIEMIRKEKKKSELYLILMDLVLQINSEIKRIQIISKNKCKKIILMGGGSKNKILIEEIIRQNPKYLIEIGESEATVKGSIKLMKEYDDINRATRNF